jgi:hypothetical protein
MSYNPPGNVIALENESLCGFSGTGSYMILDHDLVKNGNISEVGYEDNIDNEKIYQPHA